MNRILMLLIAFGLFSAVISAAESPEQAHMALLQADDGDDSEFEEEDEPDASLDGGYMALSVGRYKAAKLEFKELLRADNSNHQAAVGLAETYRLTGGSQLGLKKPGQVIKL
ncbi:MAG: hypothetical protein L3J82_10290, partial [Planctomycetes bacterium]|nr:hypothetical protein [Planctomycetota bacterium]